MDAISTVDSRKPHKTSRREKQKMGICSSRDVSNIERSKSKAKLILENGKLKVFSCPIRASQISNRSPSCFICKADNMNFDDYPLAIQSDEELELGQLYFELPEDLLNTRLVAQQMASLAVKASLALNGARKSYRCYWCGLKRMDPWEASIKREDEASPIMASGENRNYRIGLALNRMQSGGGGRKFTRKLSAILEEEGEGNEWCAD